MLLRCQQASVYTHPPRPSLSPQDPPPLTVPSAAPAVTDFDDFMKIPPCATGSHSLEAPEGAPKVAPRVESAPTSTTADGKEVYGNKSIVNDSAFKSPSGSLPLGPKPVAAQEPPKPQSTEYVEVQDDPDATVEKGTRCKRKACGQEYNGGERTDGECKYHPGVVSVEVVSFLHGTRSETN